MLSLERANAVILKYDVMPISSLSKEELATLMHARDVVSDEAKRAVSAFINHESSQKYFLELADRFNNNRPDAFSVITIQEFHD